MKRIASLTVVFVLLASATRPDAAQTQKAVASIADVEAGMPRDYVLAKLQEGYTLEKVDIGEGSDMWEVWKKGPSGDFAGEILFEQGKVVLVATRLYPPMTGEAVQLAQRLFNLLYFHANPPREPNRLEKATNVRNAVVEMQLQQRSYEPLDERIIFFTVEQDTLRMRITKNPRYPPHVDIEHLLLNGCGGFIQITQGKSKAARRLLPMVPAVYAALKARWEAQGQPTQGWVFPSAS